MSYMEAALFEAILNSCVSKEWARLLHPLQLASYHFTQCASCLFTSASLITTAQPHPDYQASTWGACYFAMRCYWDNMFRSAKHKACYSQQTPRELTHKVRKIYALIERESVHCHFLSEEWLSQTASISIPGDATLYRPLCIPRVSAVTPVWVRKCILWKLESSRTPKRSCILTYHHPPGVNGADSYGCILEVRSQIFAPLICSFMMRDAA